jgi:HAD superfamily hydrolase (TIGR01549 family)
MRPQTILFDFDGTLILDRVSLVTQFLQYCDRLGHPTSANLYAELYRWRHQFWVDPHYINNAFKNLGEHGFWVAYHRQQLDFMGARGELDQHAEQITQWFYGDKTLADHVVAADARATLTHLRAHGCTLGLVSNRARPLTDEVHKHHLADLFDFTLAAGEIGIWKPDARIFEHALKMANASAAQTLYVGDNYYIDILGARNAGLTPILIDPENIFPDADCVVIRGLSELRTLSENTEDGSQKSE